MWSKVKKFLGLLTDVLMTGRKAGLWNKTQGIEINKGKPHDPSFPDVK